MICGFAGLQGSLHNLLEVTQITRVILFSFMSWYEKLSMDHFIDVRENNSDYLNLYTDRVMN